MSACAFGPAAVEMEDGSTMDILGQTMPTRVPPGHDAWVVGDEPWVSIDSEGRRYFAKLDRGGRSRTLATILFTDIVSSTELVAQLGDSAWRDRLADYHGACAAHAREHSGREIGTTGDGVLAVFDSPARAVRCALELAAAAADLGVEQRAGLHTGEVEVSGRHPRDRGPPGGTCLRRLPAPARSSSRRRPMHLLDGSGFGTTSRGVHAAQGDRAAGRAVRGERMSPRRRAASWPRLTSGIPNGAAPPPSVRSARARTARPRPSPTRR